MKPVMVVLALFGLAQTIHATSNGLPPEFRKVLDSATSAVFYSLEPWGTSANDDAHFHSYQVLGKTTLDAKDAHAAAVAFEDAIAHWDGNMAICFDPRHALSIASAGHTYDFLLCYRCHQLEIDKDGKNVTTIGAAGSDKFLNAMLTRLHVPLSQTDTDEQIAAEAKKRAEEDARWRSATPAWAMSFYARMDNMPFDVAPLRPLLAQAYPDRQKRILALFQWYGSGAGPWSGYPSREEIPENLLFDEPTGDVITAAQQPGLTDAQIEGAARFFGGWDFSQNRPHDLALLPASLKKKFLEHSLKSSDEDKRERAEKAFR